MKTRLDHIVILGGGTAGWMTAAALAHHLRPSGIRITLVESATIGTIGVGEATIPTIRPFYQSLGLSDADVIRATGATCKLGIEFRGWRDAASTFIHPFGGFGHDFGGTGFVHYWRAQGEALGLGQIDDFAMGAALARAGRFALPNAPLNAETFNVFDWALHLDAGLFAQYLSRFAQAAGVRHIDGILKEARLDPANGHVEALVLEDGREVVGDLFIDCSGFAALLIGKALGVGYDDYSQWLFCDRAVAMPSERDAPARPLTEVTAHAAGWQWHVPLQHRSGNGHVYASRLMSDDEAVATLSDNLPGRASGEPRIIRFTPGRRQKAWDRNVIAVGLSSGFLEPLESTSIALIQTAIERIKQLLPLNGMDPLLIDEFNDMSWREFERTRDFIILHYKLNRRGDTDFWREAAAMAVPDSLQRKMDLYRVRGHFVRYRWEMFHPASWLAVYAGFDLWPEAVDPGVAHMPAQAVKDALRRMRREIDTAVAGAPLHQMFIDYCNRSVEANHVHA